ncbi:MAG: histidine kinase [Fusicatenibacter sp.]|nr:histidine kinase [Fusicatenibacter sp.]
MYTKRLSKAKSLKNILIRIFAACTILCLFLVILVTQLSMRAMHQSRAETSLAATLQEINHSLDNEYNILLRLSQNMLSTGLVGRKYDDYLTAQTQFDRIQEYKAFYETLNVASWETEDIILCSYIRKFQDQTDIIFSNFSVSDRFDPFHLQELMDTGEIVFHGLHMSYNSVMNDDVISILRPTTFEDGTEAVIYLEAKSDILNSLQNRSELESTSYAFLQLDENDSVVFSTAAEFPAGSTVAIDQDGMVRQENYIGIADNSDYGFYHVLLIPLHDYQYDMRQWMMRVAAVILISFAILGVVSFSQIWLISHPIKVLETEMQHLGDGDFSPAPYKIHISEYDHLFTTFNHMKTRIQLLIAEGQQQEKEKAQLKLDKLMYQINPHFLMNTLNSLHWMALSNQQKDIDDYVRRLGFILSYSLGKSEQKTTLRTELRYLEYYLKLQQSTHDFQYTCDVEEGAYLDQPCARFLLQPIAENAICHNLDEFGNLWIRVTTESENIRILIQDDGKGFVSAQNPSDSSAESKKQEGIGLRYVKMSLDSFYGKNASLAIQSEPGKGTRVEILLPIKNMENNRGIEHVSGTDC